MVAMATYIICIHVCGCYRDTYYNTCIYTHLYVVAKSKYHKYMYMQQPHTCTVHVCGCYSDTYHKCTHVFIHIYMYLLFLNITSTCICTIHVATTYMYCTCMWLLQRHLSQTYTCIYTDLNITSTCMRLLYVLYIYICLVAVQHTAIPIYVMLLCGTSSWGTMTVMNYIYKNNKKHFQ